MANVIIQSINTGTNLRVAKEDLIHQIQHVEKKTFPRREALDFSTELQKRNTDLVIVVDDAGIFTPAKPKVVVYMVFVHLKAGNAVLLHKICVDSDYRRQGIARTVLEAQMQRLKKHGCTRIQLWVHEENVPARGLYKILGLQEVSMVKDYYAAGRNGIQLLWELSS